ncbi:hypothetical protein [Aquimarina algicola]|uniref:STAS/SEC14 domain-containing protein n=1 Tax=Aquimarina algicola TaxID=2589995 RepID=A0A504JER2_9FLAO|nr:hypothetical protein [Aquimarina algicola]TPN89164.1 hypothetical protein FHK87_02765 [Aquimarina algicola]
MNTNYEKFYDLEFHTSYVIITIHKGVFVTLDKANIIREDIKSHFGNKSFIMITNRKFEHEVAEEVFRLGQLPNMKGLAIVSQRKTERDKAMIEQGLYDRSFAYFNTLEEAKSWAEGYF